MANLILDLSDNFLFNQEKGVRSYKYRDIGTDNIRLKYELEKNGQIKYSISDLNTSNFDDVAVKAALNNIFKYRPGQRILQPMFGNEIYQYLYEPMNKYTASKIVRTIRQMIERWEPRVEIIDIPCTRCIGLAEYII